MLLLIVVNWGIRNSLVIYFTNSSIRFEFHIFNLQPKHSLFFYKIKFAALGVDLLSNTSNLGKLYAIA